MQVEPAPLANTAELKQKISEKIRPNLIKKLLKHTTVNKVATLGLSKKSKLFDLFQNGKKGARLLFRTRWVRKSSLAPQIDTTVVFQFTTVKGFYN